MTERILNQKRLKELIKKLKACDNMDLWHKEEKNDSYEPHPDSPTVGWEEKKTSYSFNTDIHNN